MSERSFAESPDAERARSTGREAATTNPGVVPSWLGEDLPATGSARGLESSLARRALSLQQTHGNRFVERVLEGNAGSREELGRAAPAAAIQRKQAKTRVTIAIGPVQNRTFSVSGANLAEVGSALDTRDEWGRGGAESINYTGGTVDDAGIVTSLAITATLMTELPNWTGLASQPPAVRNEWNRMLGALRGHENHHVAIARTHINNFSTAFNPVADADLATLWQEKISALQSAQDAYDTTTTHGQSEGVSLDLSVDPSTSQQPGDGGEEE